MIVICENSRCFVSVEGTEPSECRWNIMAVSEMYAVNSNEFVIIERFWDEMYHLKEWIREKEFMLLPNNLMDEDMMPISISSHELE